MKNITLPDGSVLELSDKDAEEFWKRTGVKRGTDLQTLKKGHQRRVMELASELFQEDFDD